MVKVTFIILFCPIFLMTINGKPFYRPMPGLINRTLNKILTKQINERFSTKPIVEPTNMPMLVPSESVQSNLLNKIPTEKSNERSVIKSTVEPIGLAIRIPILESKFKLELGTKSNPLESLESKILKTGKLPTVVLQSKSGFQLLTQLTESRQFKSTESTPNQLSAGPKSIVPPTKLLIILESNSGFLASPNFPELTETRKQKSPEQTSIPKTSPIRSTTAETQNDVQATESTKSELDPRKHQISRAKSEKLSVPQARYKIWNPKKVKKCHLQFFEKCTFDEWSRFLNSNKHTLRLSV